MTGAGPDPAAVAAVMRQIDAARDELGTRPVVIGISGAQGSGKSTLARAAARACEARGIAGAVLSIDDIYLTRAERERLGAEVHPLLRTRGPPGTHDIALGLRTLDGLAAGRPTPLPRFDKALDDRLAPAQWPQTAQHCDVALFEGWCVGALAEPDSRLVAPVNVLEATEDADGRWRRHVNAALAGGYRALFARIDRLVLLAAPAFDVVQDWRQQQEDELRARNDGDGRAIMDAAAVARFIQHYERLTRWMLEEMPARADLAIMLDRDRRPLEFRERLRRA